MNNTIPTQVLSDVASVITELTNNDELFTAYDVTCILRRKGLNGGLSHWQLRDVVHDYFLTGNMNPDYTRTGVDFNGTSAFVYFPGYASVSMYDSTKHVFGVHATPVTVVPPVQASVPVSAPQTTPQATVDTVVADSRGRITVPKKIVDTVSGVTNTNVVSVVYDPFGDDVELYGVTPVNVSNYLKIDQYGNVKLSLGKNKAGSKYEFKINTPGHVTVSYVN